MVARYVLYSSGEIGKVWIYKSSGDALLGGEVVRAFEVLKGRGTRIPWPRSVPDKSHMVGEVTVPFRLVPTSAVATPGNVLH